MTNKQKLEELVKQHKEKYPNFDVDRFLSWVDEKVSRVKTVLRDGIATSNKRRMKRDKWHRFTTGRKMEYDTHPDHSHEEAVKDQIRAGDRLVLRGWKWENGSPSPSNYNLVDPETGEVVLPLVGAEIQGKRDLVERIK